MSAAGQHVASAAARRQAFTLALARSPMKERWKLVMKLPEAQRTAMLEEWERWAHGGQVPPPGEWRVWLIRAGRGFGKTRAGAEWVAAFARANGDARIALVGATRDEARGVMVEGESGLLATALPGDGLDWRVTTGVLRWASGAQAFIYSADAPEALRGPQHHVAWCDELGKWRRGEATWNNLMLGMRLGGDPRVVVTTTPKPGPMMRRLGRMKKLEETHGRTRDNVHLPDVFVEMVEDMFAGTRLGRQELDGELVEDAEGALWSRALIEARRSAGPTPALVRVVVGVDPPAGETGDACGIVAAGIDASGCAHVLDDASVSGLPPEGWGAAVAACARRWNADRVVAEANQGGSMVGTVLRIADGALPVRLVHAKGGKGARAEPIQTLYARGLVCHARPFPELEDELCGLKAAGGYEGPGRSPDRADACVWALWALLVDQPAEAGVRTF